MTMYVLKILHNNPSDQVALGSCAIQTWKFQRSAQTRLLKTKKGTKTLLSGNAAAAIQTLQITIKICDVRHVAAMAALPMHIHRYIDLDIDF